MHKALGEEMICYLLDPVDKLLLLEFCEDSEPPAVPARRDRIIALLWSMQTHGVCRLEG